MSKNRHFMLSLLDHPHVLSGAAGVADIIINQAMRRGDMTPVLICTGALCSYRSQEDKAVFFPLSSLLLKLL